MSRNFVVFQKIPYPSAVLEKPQSQSFLLKFGGKKRNSDKNVTFGIYVRKTQVYSQSNKYLF